MLYIEDGLVVAVHGAAADRQRADTVAAHVAQRHRLVFVRGASRNSTPIPALAPAAKAGATVTPLKGSAEA